MNGPSDGGSDRDDGWLHRTRASSNINLETQKSGMDRVFPMVCDYDVPTVSEKVVRIIQSYTDYINRVVWKNLKNKRMRLVLISTRSLQCAHQEQFN